MSVVAVQPLHGLVPLVVVGATFFNIWAGIKVEGARAKYNVPYPQMYAELSDRNAKAFNCVQRGHQSVLENMPIFLAFLFTSAIYRPLPAAICGAIRIVGFVRYFQGYSTGDPANRSRGWIGYLGLFGSLALTLEASVRMLGDL